MDNAKPNGDFGGEVIVYDQPDSESRVEVRLEAETIWLTQRQIAEVFDTTTANVDLLLTNIYAAGELSAEATTRDYPVVQTESTQHIWHTIRHYSLDAIISVGCQVNSKRGLHFLQWAIRTLCDHLARGHTLNENRLAESGAEEARVTLAMSTRTLRSRTLANDSDEIILDLIVDYADTWRLLFEYDDNRLGKPTDGKPATSALETDLATHAIETLRSELVARGEASQLFGNQRADALEAILGNIEQTMFGKPLYTCLEEKAANLLYLIVKDHPFTDGNKRIGALLFMLYLAKEGVAQPLDSQALTALTLLIAESTPANKDLMIRLVMNLLAEPAREYSDEF